MDDRFLQEKNIVFDIGNVLLSFDVDKVLTLVPENMRSAMKQAMFHSVWDASLWSQFDLGTRPNAEIALDIEKAAGIPGSAQQVLSILESFPRVMEPLPLSLQISELKRMGKRIYALTNYPEPSLSITAERFPFFREMDGMVVSSREKLVKPNPAIYKLLLDMYQLNPNDTLFIDDRLENVQAAQALGIHGWHYQG